MHDCEEAERQIVELEQRVRVLQQENSGLEGQVCYWKWQAVSYGAPEFQETFETQA